MTEIVSHWKIVLEILILWYVIYMVLLFVKGTRSEQLLKGLVFLALIFIGAQQLGLDSINWALTSLFPISVIALVVVFQPELRSGLARLGQFGLHQENIEVVDEIVKAAVTLSKKRIGALIVLERESGLKSYIESGTRVDGRVTNFLIGSIFVTQSPLHDGAIIIRRGRIVAAGCVLPLAQDENDLPKTLGMRHRAAIGISEETDAIALVVSEETGAMSVANSGKLLYNLSEESVARILSNIFSRPSKKRVSFNIASRRFHSSKQEKG